MKFSKLYPSFTQQMLPLNTNIRLAYSNGRDDEQNFIQNLSLFLCTFLKEHGQLIEKKLNIRETLMEVRTQFNLEKETVKVTCTLLMFDSHVLRLCITCCWCLRWRRRRSLRSVWSTGTIWPLSSTERVPSPPPPLRCSQPASTSTCRPADTSTCLCSLRSVTQALQQLCLGVCDVYRLRYYHNCCFNDVQFDNIEYFAKTKQNA